MFKNFTPTACSNHACSNQAILQPSNGLSTCYFTARASKATRRGRHQRPTTTTTQDEKRRETRRSVLILHSTSNTSLTFQSLLLYVTTIEWTTMVQNWSGLPRRIYWHLWAVHFTTRLHTKLKFYEMPPPHLPLKSQELVSLIWLPLHHHTMRSLHTMQLNYQRRRDG